MVFECRLTGAGPQRYRLGMLQNNTTAPETTMRAVLALNRRRQTHYDSEYRTGWFGTTISKAGNEEVGGRFLFPRLSLWTMQENHVCSSPLPTWGGSAGARLKKQWTIRSKMPLLALLSADRGLPHSFLLGGCWCISCLAIAWPPLCRYLGWSIKASR
jgi:hypothetical protein